jgi:uncharacterized protein (DUF2147 family)
MRTILIAGAALLALAGPSAAAQRSVMGEWLVQDGSARVRLTPCRGAADQLCGVITWLKRGVDANGRPTTDTNNPDANLRRRPVVGLEMITGVPRSGPNLWRGGQLYDPSSGKSFKSKIELKPDGTLSVEGCIFVLCNGQVWTPA